MNLLADLTVIAPLWITGAAAALVLLLTVAGGVRRPAPDTGTHLVFISLLGLSAAAWLLWQGEGTAQAFSGAIVVDGLGRVFGITAVIGGILGVFFAATCLKEHQLSAGEFLALILLSVVGMLILA